MEPVDISPDVLNFLVRRIDSVPHLETLLLFFESPDAVWTTEEISRRVYVSRETAATILQDLARHSFIALATTANSYRYEESWDSGRIMPHVVATYRRHLVHVTSFIHDKAASGAVQAFAKAFRFKDKS